MKPRRIVLLLLSALLVATLPSGCRPGQERSRARPGAAARDERVRARPAERVPEARRPSEARDPRDVMREEHHDSPPEIRGGKDEPLGAGPARDGPRPLPGFEPPQPPVFRDGAGAGAADDDEGELSEKKRRAVERDLTDRLLALEAKIESLQRRVSDANKSVRESLRGALDDVKKRRRVARERLDDLQDAPAKRWRDLRARTEDALEDLQQAYEAGEARL